MPNVVYASIRLNPIDSLVLKGILVDHCPAPDNGKEFCHHLTIKFRPTVEDCQAIPFGKVVPMKVKGLYCDGDVAAFTVEFLHGQPCEISNPVPHITGWTAEDVPPRFSNKLLAEQTEPVAKFNELIVGYVSWFDGSDQEHKESTPYSQEDIDCINRRKVLDGLQSRPWDREYQLALSTMK